jgi:hypothetical protein
MLILIGRVIDAGGPHSSRSGRKSFPSGWSMARPTDPHVLEDGVGIPDKALVHMRASGELTRKLHP